MINYHFKFVIKIAIAGAILAAGLSIFLPTIAEMSREGAELIAIVVNVIAVLLFLNILFIGYAIFKVKNKRRIEDYTRFLGVSTTEIPQITEKSIN